MRYKKFYKLFLTLLLSVLIILLLYTALHYITVYLFGIRIKEFWIDFWGPVLLTIPLVFFVIRKILKATRISEKTREFLLWLYIPVTIVLPTMLAQSGLRDYNATKKSVNNVRQISFNDTETYYSVDSFYIDKKIKGLFSSIETIKRINLYHHYVYPIFKDSSDKQTPYVWYGLKFQTDIAPLDPDKEKLIQEFAIATGKTEKAKKLYGTRLFKRERLNSDADKFQSAIDLFEWSRHNKNIILTPMHESYEEIHEEAFSETITFLEIITIAGFVTSLIIIGSKKTKRLD
ncbi:MAG: hypothetical protein WC760_06655 [Bacteroidia bacterium]|jgi:hypothetical protein